LKRVGFILKVREDLIEEYKDLHMNVWPEMKQALKKSGWHNYSLFMSKNGMIFGYFEATKSFYDSLKNMNNEEINTKWQNLMSPYFEIPKTANPDQSMIELEEVFHLD
tara:strand:- start:723 stop:1046 length:324 start_codon:yes stop_codon:yes gene_type:complete